MSALREADVVIAGAGPAGLASARAVALAGHRVVLLDGRPDDGAGSGLTLWPNALSAAGLLGLRDAIEAAGRSCDGMAMSTPGGTRLQGLSATAMRQHFGGNGLGIHRSALIRVLRAAVPDTVEVRPEMFTAATVHDDRVVVSTNRTRIMARILVGADGGRSRVRGCLGHDREPNYPGMRVVRGVSERDLADHPAEVRFGRGLQFGIFTLPRGTYWFAAFPVPPGPPRAVAGHLPPDPAAVRRLVQGRFGRWGAPVGALIEATGPEHMLVHDVVERAAPTDRWGRGPVTLTGDAAHLAAPTMGQGTGHALEDAVALGSALRGGTEPVRLRTYEQIRRPRVSAMVKAAHLAAVAGRWDGRVVCALRDLSLRLTPETVQVRQLRGMFDLGEGDLLAPVAG